MWRAAEGVAEGATQADPPEGGMLDTGGGARRGLLSEQALVEALLPPQLPTLEALWSLGVCVPLCMPSPVPMSPRPPSAVASSCPTSRPSSAGEGAVTALAPSPFAPARAVECAENGVARAPAGDAHVWS